MPIYDIGYRHYEGKRESPYLRWLVIARMTIGLNMKNKFIRKMMFSVYIPTLIGSVCFFLLGKATGGISDDQISQLAYQFVSSNFSRDWAHRLAKGDAQVQLDCWRIAMSFYLFHSQTWISLFLVGMLGNSFMSQDIKHKTLQLYFSKPVKIWDYVLGKAASIAFFIGAIALAPPLFLYFASILAAPSLSVLWHTFPIVFDIFAYFLVLVIPCSLIVLGMSCLTNHHRIVGFMWSGLWMLGMFFQGVLGVWVMIFRRADSDPLRNPEAWWTGLPSIYTNIIAVGGKIFRLDKIYEHNAFPRDVVIVLRQLQHVDAWSYSLLVLVLASGLSLWWIVKKLVTIQRQ